MEKLISNIKHMREKVLTRDEDRVILMIGKERSGKSTLALILAKKCDPNFTIDNICWTLEALVDRVRSSPKGSILIADESILLASKRRVMSKVGNNMQALIKIMGEFNKILILITPSFDDLDKTIIRDRIQGVIRITKRARYRVYNKKQTQMIRQHKWKRGLWYPPFSYNGSFPSAKTIIPEAWKQYKERKGSLLDDPTFLDGLKPKKDKELITHFPYKVSDLAKMVGVHTETIRNRLINMEQNVDFIVLKSGQRRFSDGAITHI